LHLDYRCKFASLNHLSDKTIEHSLPFITQFGKIVNHCIKNKLDLKDYIGFDEEAIEAISKDW